MKRCDCGNDEFHAHQEVCTDVVVNADNLFLNGGEPYESDNPYGPYTCVECGKEYEELSDLPDAQQWEIQIKDGKGKVQDCVAYRSMKAALEDFPSVQKQSEKRYANGTVTLLNIR